MAVRKALLVQDISDFIGFIREPLEKALDTSVYDGVETADALKWILEHELELIFGLASKNHNRNHQPYALIHSLVDSLTQSPLSVMVARHVGVPIIDYDHTVEIEIKGNDLYIRYVPGWKTALELRNYIKHLHHEQSKREVVFGPNRSSAKSVSFGSFVIKTRKQK